MEKDGDKAELTIKQRRFVRAYLEGKPMVQAAAEAGYSPTTGARGATELLRSSKVRSAIQHALEEAGVTDERLAAVIKDGLDACKSTHLVHDGEIHELRSEDWQARLRFVDTVLRLKAAYPENAPEVAEETYEERIFRLRGLPITRR